MSSAAILLRSVMRLANAATDSIMKSRAATASIEFSIVPSNPRSSHVRIRFTGKPVPANAAAPSGLWFTRVYAPPSRSKSRASAPACASRWCASVVGWACWVCVNPGVSVSICSFACVIRTCLRLINSRIIFKSSSRSRMRMHVATSSLRLRPVCMRPPVSSPTISMSFDSIAAWISSSGGSAEMPSFWITLIAESMREEVSAVIMPSSVSITTCARSTLMSASNIHLSESIEDVNRRTSAGCAERRALRINAPVGIRTRVRALATPGDNHYTTGARGCCERNMP